jgi:SAM-dependent methyltransferase
VPLYEKFALVYDQMGADRHSQKMAGYTLEIMRRFKIRAATGLDLCCGTGSAVARLADHGLEMAGLDQSPHMLAMATRKLKGRSVTLYRKSLPKFRLLDSRDSRRLRRFDLVTCFYDSLNYLKGERALKGAFRSVYEHLNSPGWFVFDMNTPSALKTLWDDSIHADVRDNLAWVWKLDHFPKTRSSACYATFFVKRGRTWERFDEVHYEYGYTNGTIRRLLREVGFEVKGFYDCGTFRKPTSGTSRICAVAKKTDKHGR